MFVELFNDNGKPDESLGRKAKGPDYRFFQGIIKWQPVTEGEVFCLAKNSERAVKL